MAQQERQGGFKALAFGIGVVAFLGLIVLRAEARQGQVYAVDPPPRHLTGQTVTPPPPPPRMATLRGEGISGSFSLSQTVVAAGTPSRVFAELQVKGADAQQAPTSIAVVLDVSGSMRGSKIETAKASIRSLIAQMRPDDWLSITTYSDRANVLVEGYVGSIGARALMQVGALRVNGGTNIRAGILTAATSLAGAPRGRVGRLLLVSDGRDTYHATAQEIAQTRRSYVSNAVVSTLGVGLDYDEDFLFTLAQQGEGNYAYLANLSRMGSFFEREIQQSRSTSATNVRAIVSLPAGMSIGHAWGGTQTGYATYDLGVVQLEQAKQLALAIDVNPRAVGHVGEISVRLEYTPVVSAMPTSLVSSLNLEASLEQQVVAQSQDPVVFARSQVLRLAEQQNRAVEALSQGNVEEADRLSGEVRREAAGLIAAAPAASAEFAPVSAVADETVTATAMGSAPSEPEARALRARARAATRSGAELSDAVY